MVSSLCPLAWCLILSYDNAEYERAQRYLLKAILIMTSEPRGVCGLRKIPNWALDDGCIDQHQSREDKDHEGSCSSAHLMVSEFGRRLRLIPQSSSPLLSSPLLSSPLLSSPLLSSPLLSSPLLSSPLLSSPLLSSPLLLEAGLIDI